MKLRVVFSREPQWLTLVEGVEVQIRPVTKIEQAAARAYAKRKSEGLHQEATDAQALGASVADLPDFTNPDVTDAVDELLYAQGLARQIVLDWKGVEDEAGQPLPVTEENIDNFVRLAYVGDWFLRQVQEQLGAMLQEGNASAP